MKKNPSKPNIVSIALTFSFALSLTLLTSCAFVQNTDSSTASSTTNDSDNVSNDESHNVPDKESNSNIQSSIVQFKNTHKTPYDGSDFYTYFYGETIGTKNTRVGLAIIEPNNEIHPPHQHAEEEYLYIVEGSGIWTLNGVEIPAKTGDVLYVAPWDIHGIFNTGAVPMKFFITRASSKGVIVEKP